MQLYVITCPHYRRVCICYPLQHRYSHVVICGELLLQPHFLAAILISLVMVVVLVMMFSIMVALIPVPGNGCCCRCRWTRRMFCPTVAVTMETEVSTEYVQKGHVMQKGPNY